MTAGLAYESSAVREITYTITNKGQSKQAAVYPVLAVYGLLEIKSTHIITHQYKLI